MRYICLGYMNEEMWNALPETQRKGFVDQCLAYDAELGQKGHFVTGLALQSVRAATTLRSRGGKVTVTDGPFAETKEQLGGVLVLDATDLNHAIRLMSRHPSVAVGGTWEIRPADEQIVALYRAAGVQVGGPV